MKASSYFSVPMVFNNTVTTEVLEYFTFYLNRYVLLIAYMFGNIENVLTAIIFAKKCWRKNVCVFYLTVYLVISFAYLNSIVLTSIFVYGYDIDLQNVSTILCKLYFYCAYIFLTLSPTILILASVDRLLISSQNVDTRLYSSKRLAYFSISLSTLFWMIFSIHTLIKVSIYEVYPSRATCYYDIASSYSDFVSYSSIVFVASFFIIILVLCICSFKNVRHIRFVPRSQRHQLRTMTKKDFQLLRCLFAYDLVFITCCVPLILVTVYQVILKGYAQVELLQIIENFAFKTSMFIAHVPFWIGFYICLAISKAFRTELKRMLYRISNQPLVSTRDDENKD